LIYAATDSYCLTQICDRIVSDRLIAKALPDDSDEARTDFAILLSLIEDIHTD
jgi:hypothetical protein